jgi:hypothetical protein
MAKMKKKPETDAPAPHGGEKFQRPDGSAAGKIYYWITVRRKSGGIVHVPIRTPPKGKGGRRLAAKYNARKRAETTGGTGAGRQREAGKLRSMRESAAEYRKSAGGLAAATRKKPAPKAGNPESAKRARLDRLGARSDLDREHLAVTRQGFADDIGRLHRINSRSPSKNVRGAIQKLRSEARAYESHAVGRGTLEFRREGNGTAIYKPTATPSPAATAAPAPAAATPAPAAAKVASRGTPKRKEDATALREAKRRRDAGLATKDPDRISAAHIGYSYARKTYGTGTPNRLKRARLYRKEQERRANRTVPTIDPNYKSPQQQVLERQAEKLNKTMAARASRSTSTPAQQVIERQAKPPAPERAQRAYKRLIDTMPGAAKRGMSYGMLDRRVERITGTLSARDKANLYANLTRGVKPASGKDATAKLVKRARDAMQGHLRIDF